MLKVTIKWLTEGRAEAFYDDEPAVIRRLHEELPESRPYGRLDDCIQAIGEYGQAEVEAVPWAEPAEQNLLHENYLTADEGPDPWLREG